MARYSVERGAILGRNSRGVKPRIRAPGAAPKTPKKLDKFMDAQMKRVKAGLTRMEHRIHKEHLRSTTEQIENKGTVGYSGRRCPNLATLEEDVS